MLFSARGLSRPLVVLTVALLPAVANAGPVHRKGSSMARVIRKSENKLRDSESRAEGAETGAQSHGAAPAPVHVRPEAKARGCFSEPIEVVAGAESAIFSLTKCNGSATPLAIDQLSLLARPSAAAKPRQPLELLAKAAGADLAPGIRRFDARIVERLSQVAAHFRAEGEPPHVVLVSGYRPRGAGSYHSTGRAIDFRVAGVTDEAVLAFCKTLPDTGCGYYPNSNFVHMDVRDAGAGHVAWIDASRPGELPRYVAHWPTGSSDASKLPALPRSGPQEGTPPLEARKNASDSAPHSI